MEEGEESDGEHIIQQERVDWVKRNEEWVESHNI
jgi:hypothetical protein